MKHDETTKLLCRKAQSQGQREMETAMSTCRGAKISIRFQRNYPRFSLFCLMESISVCHNDLCVLFVTKDLTAIHSATDLVSWDAP